MGRYKFFNDYLLKRTEEHFRVVKEMKYLDDDDDRLLVPVLFYLANDERTRLQWMHEIDYKDPEKYYKFQQLAISSPFYGERYKYLPQSSTNLTQRNAARMIELALLLKKIRGHNYNIYECCFLAIGGLDRIKGLLFMAACSMIAQILLLVILMYFNLSNITNGDASWSKDWCTIVVVIITTFFFAKLVHVQWRGASDFKTVFSKAGFPSRIKLPLLWINILVNGALGAAVVVFNIFFLLISAEDVNEAVLNSLALFFILEMDDMLRPQWDDVKIDTRIACNLNRYIAGDDGEDIQVKIISSSLSKDDYFYLLQSDDKIHFKATDDDGKLVVTMYCSSPFKTSCERIQFCISGENGRDRDLFDNIKKFHCVQIDELGKVVTMSDFIAALKRLEEQRQNEQVPFWGDFF